MIRSLFDGELPKAIFFDLDGTLVDSVPDLAAAVDAMLDDLHFPVAGVDKVRLWVGNGARVLVQRAIADALSCAEDAVDEVKLEPAHKLFLKHYGRTSGQHSCLYEGVQKTLDALQQAGIILVIITNKPAQFTPAVLAEHGIEHYFSLVISGDTLTDKKPHPAQLHYAVEQLELDHNACLMVGDSRNDIEAADQAGIVSVCVTYGYNHGDDARQLNANLFADQFSQLISDLDQL